MRFLIILCGLLSCTNLSFADAILRVSNTPSQQNIIDKFSFECLSRNPDFIDILWNEKTAQLLSSEPELEQIFLKNSIITEEDINTQFSSITRSADLGSYHSFPEMQAFLEDTVKRYPKLARLEIVDNTHENNPIYALVMGTKNKPAFLILGGHHAREWISHEVPIALIKNLTDNYAQDTEAKEILDNCLIVVVPMLNVDGAIYSQTTAPMWRKNRRPTTGTSVGVDNNRNYDYKWGIVGATSWPSSDTYMGTEPMSEKENQAIKKLQEKYHFTASVSYHSYSELVLWPWSYTNHSSTKDNIAFAKMGQEMAAIMGYKGMQSAGLYPSAGDTDDFLYGNYGVFSFTIELGKRFVPTEEQAEVIKTKSIKMLRHLLINGRTPFAEAKQERLYAIQSILENILYNTDSDLAERTADYQKLLMVREAELKEAMQKMQINTNRQKQILTELGQLHRYQEIK